DGPAHGTLAGTAPNLTYTPPSNYNGSDSINIIAIDGLVDTAEAIISITSLSVNDKPVHNPQSLTDREDTAKNITLTGTDVDGDGLTFSVESNPSHGTLSGTAPTLLYTPDPNYNGPDSFTFKVSDGTNFSETAQVSITVTAVNDAPVADSLT